MKQFDPQVLKKEFPLLGRTISGHPLTYLDNAATTHKPVQVLDALDGFYTQHNANIHRGVHLLAEEATLLYEQARDKVATFLNAASPKEVIFTSGTTQSINLVASSWGQANLKPNQTIVLTQMEHHANLLPWQRLASQTGAKLEFIPITDQGCLVENWSDYITPQTALVAFPHVSNLLGTNNPAPELVQAAHAVGAVALIDAAQSVPAASLDAQQLKADFVAFSGHKMLGPTGIGVLYGKEQLLQHMEPYQLGGEMIAKVTYDSATWHDLPWKFEAGTPHIAGAIALGVAIDYLQSIGGGSAIRLHHHHLTRYATTALSSVKGLTLYGPTNPDQRSPIFSFTIENIHPHDLASLLDEQGIAIRSGHHCAQPLTNLLGVPATARASFYIYNSTQDVDKLIQGLETARRKLG